MKPEYILSISKSDLGLAFLLQYSRQIKKACPMLADVLEGQLYIFDLYTFLDICSNSFNKQENIWFHCSENGFQIIFKISFDPKSTTIFVLPNVSVISVVVDSALKQGTSVVLRIPIQSNF